MKILPTFVLCLLIAACAGPTVSSVPVTVPASSHSFFDQVGQNPNIYRIKEGFGLLEKITINSDASSSDASSYDIGKSEPTRSDETRPDATKGDLPEIYFTTLRLCDPKLTPSESGIARQLFVGLVIHKIMSISHVPSNTDVKPPPMATITDMQATFTGEDLVITSANLRDQSCVADVVLWSWGSSPINTSPFQSELRSSLALKILEIVSKKNINNTDSTAVNSSLPQGSK